MKTHSIEARKKVFKSLKLSSLLVLDAGQAPHRSLDAYHAFDVDHNFYYLTGIRAPNARLLLLKTASEEKTMLFLEADTPLSLKWEGAKFSKAEAIKVGGFKEDEVFTLDQFAGRFNQLMNFARSPFGIPPENLYIDLYHENVTASPRALGQFSDILAHYPEFTVVNVNHILAALRMIKSDEEIAAIKKAIFYTHQGLKTIIKNLPKRSYEFELVADFTHQTTLIGSSGQAFETIAAAGENATVLHYVSNQDAIKGDLMLFDLGAKHGMYNADISRTYPVSGRFKGKAKAMYEAVLSVQKEMIELVAPGMTWKQLNEISRARLADKAVALGFIENTADISEVYYHSIGHFLGLDVHDVGLYTQPFAAGMVLTIEPGLYSDGMGVRIEDNILVTSSGHENLSSAIEKEVADIEKLF